MQLQGGAVTGFLEIHERDKKRVIVEDPASGRPNAFAFDVLDT